MSDERAPSIRISPRSPGAAGGEVGFRNRGRVPPVYLALLLLLVGAYLSPLVTGSAPSDPRYWWTVPVFMIGGLTVPLAPYLHRSCASVTVTDDGLLVRDRLVVPADKIGAVHLVGGGQAAWAGLIGAQTIPRVQGPQNLYGGGFGWGKGVGVEHVRHGGSTWWLLPGPRADDLAEALRTSRDRAAAPRQVSHDD